jgi:hypothetical protein
MSGRSESRFVVICDGCGKEGEIGANATETRGMAYLAGWRFPSKVQAKNRKASYRASDVCGDCIAEWEPKEVGWSASTREAHERDLAERFKRE